MKVLVTGSRVYRRRSMVEAVLSGIYATSITKIRKEETPSYIVMHGHANGADMLAGNWARLQNEKGGFFYVDEMPVPADWDLHGKAAGAKRNQQMVDIGADICIAFKDDFDWTFSHGGTEDCVKRAMAAGIPTYVIQKVEPPADA